MERRESKVMKRSYVINKIRRISALMDAREHWNFIAGIFVIALSVIGVLCYFFA